MAKLPLTAPSADAPEDPPEKKERLSKAKGDHLAKDVQVAAGMASLVLLSKDGMQAMQQVLQGASDPAAAIAHAMFLAIVKVREALQQRKMPVDDKVWIMGGGVLDRVLFEEMLMLTTALKFQPAGTSAFVAKVKSDILDLLEDSDQNDEAIRVLHDKGLPAPKGPTTIPDPSAGPEQDQQGLLAQQGPPQQQAPQGVDPNAQ